MIHFNVLLDKWIEDYLLKFCFIELVDTKVCVTHYSISEK